MLKLIIKDKANKITHEVGGSHDYADIEDIYTNKVYTAWLEKVSDIVEKLSSLDPTYDSSGIAERIKSFLEQYPDDFQKTILCPICWTNGLEIIPTGEAWEIELFEAAKAKGCNIAEWFSEVEGLDLHDKAKFYWLLVECGYDYDYSIRHLEDTSVYQEPLRKAAEIIFDEVYLHEVPDHLQTYIDYDGFAYNLRAGGDLREFTFAGQSWTAENNH